MWKSFRWKECTFCQHTYMFCFWHNSCLHIIFQYLSLQRKTYTVGPHCKTQSYTVPKLWGNCDFQSYNNRNTDLNMARHLHQMHLKRWQEHSITGRCYRIAKISACVNVFITIRLFSRLVWLLGLNMSVFKHSIWLQMAVYLCLHHVYFNEYMWLLSKKGSVVQLTFLLMFLSVCLSTKF